MNDVYTAIAVIESELRTPMVPRLKQWWLKHPGGLRVSRPVLIQDCPATGDDLLDDVFGVHPENTVLKMISDNPWIVVQHTIPIGLFASASILVCRMHDEDARLYMIDIAEQRGPFGPKTLYPLVDCDLDSF